MASDTREAEIDEKIAQARKHFFNAVLAKKRSIRRNFLEMGSITNEHLIDTLTYRALLNKATESNSAEEKDNSLKQNDDYTNTGIGTSLKSHSESPKDRLQLQESSSINSNVQENDWEDEDSKFPDEFDLSLSENDEGKEDDFLKDMTSLKTKQIQS